MAGWLGQLTFDATDADTILASSNAGALVRSGDGGALITEHNSVKTAIGTFDFVDADVTAGSDTIAETAHGMQTGELLQLSSSGTLPAGLSAATDYYVIRVDANTFKLASSAENAHLGIAVDITAAAGGGTHTVTGQEQEVRALDVYFSNQSIEVTATDLDIRDLAFATDSVTAHQGGTWTIDSITNDVSIDDGGNSITVDAIDLDIRDLAFATDSVDVSGSEVSLDAATLAALETITVNQGTSPWVIGDGGGSITVDAVQLDIDDLNATDDAVASWLFDGAGTALTSTLVGADQALDVNVVGGVNVEVDLSHLDDSVRLGDGTNFLTSTTVGSDIGLDVYMLNDSSVSNTAIASAQNPLSVADTAEDVVVSPLADRKDLFIKSMGNKVVYVGASGVSSSTGFPLYPQEALHLKAGAAIDIEWVSSDVNQKVATLELS